ncbi:hypothetical protein FNV43_RR21813 [Rhamnella rubrinervis]|uniref:Uncharacterized protein n=1 Tax=Rhamnella rubrinervis TaxID=2594499 RepID=A0A8K0GRY7_9ROSA|nr:hypothetical protein FNV43_RR21813 [Rhamnella rubrinervis]
MDQDYDNTKRLQVVLSGLSLRPKDEEALFIIDITLLGKFLTTRNFRRCGYVDYVTGRCNRKKPVIIIDKIGTQANIYGLRMKAENGGTVTFMENPAIENQRLVEGKGKRGETLGGIILGKVIEAGLGKK